MGFTMSCRSWNVEVVERRWLSLFGGRISEDLRRPALWSLLRVWKTAMEYDLLGICYAILWLSNVHCYITDIRSTVQLS
jgi:hypothetical protein